MEQEASIWSGMKPEDVDPESVPEPEIIQDIRACETMQTGDLEVRINTRAND